MIEVVTFDGDQTLWDFQAVMRRSLGVVLEELAARYPTPAVRALSVETLVAIREVVEQDASGDPTDLEALRLRAFERTVEYVGLAHDGLAEELNELYLRHRWHDVQLYPDTVPVLTSLRERVAVGLVSNGNSFPDRAGLGDLFNFTVFSQDHAVAKPDPKIFAIAARTAEVSPAAMVHVGDSWSHDVEGARGAGIRSVWLNREHLPVPSSAPCDAVIHTLNELPQLLEAWDDYQP